MSEKGDATNYKVTHAAFSYYDILTCLNTRTSKSIEYPWHSFDVVSQFFTEHEMRLWLENKICFFVDEEY